MTRNNIPEDKIWFDKPLPESKGEKVLKYLCWIIMAWVIYKLIF